MHENDHFHPEDLALWKHWRDRNGSDAVNATLASPVFALNDYGSTPFATAAGNFPNLPFFIQGLGGVLSQNDAGNQLQLEDATMRAQFNNTGCRSAGVHRAARGTLDDFHTPHRLKRTAVGH